MFLWEFTFARAGNWYIYQPPKENTHSLLTEPCFWRLGIPYFLENGKLLLAKGIISPAPSSIFKTMSLDS